MMMQQNEKNEKVFKLFISYSNLDSELVNRLSADLAKNGIDVFFDDKGIQAGQDWRKVLTEALISADGVLFLLTPNSVKSEYVLSEIGMARASEKLIIPVIYGKISIPSTISDLYAIIWDDDYNNTLTKIIRRVYNDVNDIILPDPKEPSSQTSEVNQKNYWILKMNPETWKIDRYEEGTKTYFNTHYFGNPRPEKYLFSEVKKGDYVLGYSSGDIESISCLMEVETPVVQNMTNGEGFEMNILRKYNPAIPYANFRSIYEETSNELRKYQNPGQLFFRISENQYHNIIKSASEAESPFVHSFNPSYLTEGNHGMTEDQLEFEADINSFASVIALNSVKPPLAIGLFGNWGSGKSFFMEKLEDRIDSITQSNNPEYIKNVVQVWFNSWHYSDTNLWASLTTQIFESLHDYATKKEYGAEAIESMYKDLNTTSYQLEETKRKLESNTTQATSLEERKSEIEKTIEFKKERLTIWEEGDLLKIVFSDPIIQNDLKAIQSEFNEEGITENLGEIKNKLSEIDTVGSQLYESVVLLKQKGNWKWIWIFAGIIAILGYLVLGPFKETIKTIISGGTIVTGLTVTWLFNFMHKLAPYFKRIRTFHARLKSLKETVEKEKEKAQIKEQDEIVRLNSDIQSLLAEKERLELSQQQTEDKKLKLETQLKEIGSGKLLSHFLEGKTTDDAYIKQLGIVSWIRKDFAKLDELFQKQKKVQNKETDLSAEVQIDRIVLYIDDLDRCNEDIVVKVLEAIHLLLAFELFVVVVGVDPRWLNNALSEKYKTLFGKNQNSSTEDTNNTEIAPVLNEVATSYDYLEKIFQIPFALKPINKSGREKLISYLVKNEVDKKIEPTNSEPVKVETETEEKPKIDTTEELASLPNDKKDIPVAFEEMKSKERLVFSKAEIAYMQQISSIFGKTPRTINRYVNIYRIIKAHGNLKASEGYSKSDYMPIMYLLGIIVGHSMYAKRFVHEISKSNEAETFSKFIDRVDFDNNFKTIIQSSSKEIETFEMKNFIKNLELISRFSFRTLMIDN